MNVFSNKSATFTINLLLILLSAFLLNSFLDYKNYTLEKNGHWESTKAGLKGLPGVYANMFTKPALVKNRLNPAAWFGYQELIYHKPLNATTLNFRYQCWDYPFTFILDKSDSFTYGIYFHYNKDSSCNLFIADREGKFLFKKNFDIGSERIRGKWNEISMKRSADSIYLSINSRRSLSEPFKIPETVHFGFRGGPFPVFVDDVMAFDEKGKTMMKENFTPNFELNWQPIVFAAVFFALLFFFYKSSHNAWLTAFNLSVLIGFIACYLFYFFCLSHRYPTNIDTIDWHGKKVTFDVQDTVCSRLRARYSEVKHKPVVLFIGSSQTWGAGASSPEHAYPTLVEKNLRNYFRDSSITVINSGICGTYSELLYKLYTEEWYQLHPILTVIDLSNNDQDTMAFRKYIRKFLEFNRLNNIKTLLIAEPNNFVFERYLTTNHKIMKEEGLRANVSIVTMQDYTDRAYETGFLWWDWVHMTDYGYRVFSESITPYLVKELESDSLLPKFNIAASAQTGKEGRFHSR